VGAGAAVARGDAAKKSPAAGGILQRNNQCVYTGPAVAPIARTNGWHAATGIEAAPPGTIIRLLVWCKIGDCMGNHRLVHEPKIRRMRMEEEKAEETEEEEEDEREEEEKEEEEGYEEQKKEGEDKRGDGM
jgi:hypothetical protein